MGAPDKDLSEYRWTRDEYRRLRDLVRSKRQEVTDKASSGDAAGEAAARVELYQARQRYAEVSKKWEMMTPVPNT